MPRNIIRYLLILAASGVLSVLYNTYYMTIIFLMLAILPLFLLAVLNYISAKLSVALEVFTYAVKKGEAVPVSVRIKNPTIFPITTLKFSLLYKNSYASFHNKKIFSLMLDAHSESTAACELISDYAGNLEISITGVRIYDYMKLFSRRKKKREKHMVSILPDYYELPEIMRSQRFSNSQGSIEIDRNSMKKNGDDPNEINSVREYRMGDRRQRIHRKLSQKLNRLMIKELDELPDCCILVLIDLYVPRREELLIYLDALLESAFSISFTLIQLSKPHYFTWYDEKVDSLSRILIRREEDFYEAMGGLFRVLPSHADTDIFSMYSAMYPNDHIFNLIYITCVWTGDIKERIAKYSVLLKQIICICGADEVFGEEAEQDTEQDGVSIRRVEPGDVKQNLERMQLI